MANVPISAFTVPANTVGIGATGYSLTGSASASFMDLAGTWNTSGTPTAIKLNITDTASNAASLLMDLQVGGASRSVIAKSGQLTVYATASRILTLGGTLPNAVRVGSTSAIGFSSAADAATADNDTILTRRGPANLRLGAADAAAPVAQTLSVQGRTGTDAAATAYPFTIQGAQGTGTGAGGSIVFQVAPAGTAGSTPNALATAFYIASDSRLYGDANTSISMSGGFLQFRSFGSLILNVGSTATFNASIIFGTDNAVDIGASGASRPRTINVGTSIVSPGFTFLLSTMLGSGFSASSISLVNSGNIAFSRETVTTGNILIGRATGTVNPVPAFEFGDSAWSATPSAISLTAPSGAGTNIAGGSLTLLGGVSTGSAAGGSVNISVTPAGSSGTGRNTAVVALTVDSVGSVRVVRALTVATLPTAPLAGMIARVTDATAPTIGMTVVGGGAAYALVNYNGANWTVIGV